MRSKVTKFAYFATKIVASLMTGPWHHHTKLHKYTPYEFQETGKIVYFLLKWGQRSPYLHILRQNSHYPNNHSLTPFHQVGNSMVTELQIREIWATFWHIVDLSYGLFDNSHFNILWLYPCYHIIMKLIQLHVRRKIWGQKCAGNGITSENCWFFLLQFSKRNVWNISPWLTIYTFFNSL